MVGLPGDPHIPEMPPRGGVTPHIQLAESSAVCAEPKEPTVHGRSITSKAITRRRCAPDAGSVDALPSSSLIDRLAGVFSNDFGGDELGARLFGALTELVAIWSRCRYRCGS